MALNRKRVSAHFRFKYQLLPQVDKFSCFRVLFRSKGTVEHEIYRQFCVVFAVMWPLYWSVVVKTELPLYCFFGGFFVHSYPHLRPTKIILQIQAAGTVPGLRERNSELLLQQIRRTLLQWFRRLSRNCQNVCGEGFEHVQLGLSPRAFPGKAEEIMSLSWLGWGMFEVKLLPPQPRSDTLFWQFEEVKWHI